MLRGSRPEMSGCLGKRWMTGAKRKWFRSLFQILNQPSLQATTADLNCGTCDFLFPAQIMIVWTTGALAPRPLEPQEEELVVGSNESADGNRKNIIIDSEISQAKQSIFSPNTTAFIDAKLHISIFYGHKEVGCLSVVWKLLLLVMKR